jgi:hypothetical protein
MNSSTERTLRSFRLRQPPRAAADERLFEFGAGTGRDVRDQRHHRWALIVASTVRRGLTVEEGSSAGSVFRVVLITIPTAALRGAEVASIL